MKVLIACEFSGLVRDAFARLGHDAWSCDLLPSERPGQHIQGDVLPLLRDQWDLIIAHPPCTYLCSSGLHWNGRIPWRGTKTLDALDFVIQIMNANAPRIAIENPIGRIGTAIRPADQIIQPYDFGEDASKATCLWLKGLPLLRPTLYVVPRLVCCGETIEIGKLCAICGGINKPKKRWGNQTNSGQNKLAPSETRAMDRARTYPGIGTTMADQWGL